MARTPFKMKGWSPFTKTTDESWEERVYSAQRRGIENEKRIKEQKESGEIERTQERISKGNKGAVPIMPQN